MGGGIEGQKTGAPAAQLKVQVGATGRARHAHRPQHLPLVEPLARRHAGAEQVGVEGLPTRTMVEQHGGAITTDRLHQQHPAGTGSEHRRALVGGQIHPGVHAPGAPALGIAPAPGVHAGGEALEGIGQGRRPGGLPWGLGEGGRGEGGRSERDRSERILRLHICHRNL